MVDNDFGLAGIGGSTLSQLGSGLAGGLFSRFATLASLGGVSFAIIDSREEIGRRINRVLFPDLPTNRQIFQDFGQIDSPITVSGVIVGDDYVVRAERMRRVLGRPGSLTLLHPWWGRLRVRLVAPATIRFSEQEIRVAHFQAQLVRDPGLPAGSGFFGSLFDSVNTLLTDADGLLDECQTAIAGVLSAVSLPLSLINSVSSLISQGHGIWDSLTVRSPEPVKYGIVSAQATMNSGVVAPRQNLDGTYAGSVATALIVTPAALTDCVSVAEQSVIAAPDGSSGGSAQSSSVYSAASSTQGSGSTGTGTVGLPSEAVTGQQVAAILLAGAEQFGQVSDRLSLSSPEPAAVLALGVAARGVIVSQLASAWADASFTSNQDAEQLLGQITGAIDALVNDVVAAGSGRATVSLQPLFGRLQAVRSALIADATARIGSLPAVVDVPLTTGRSLWSVCYALEGDNVGNVQPLLDDAVRRNGLSHPALTGPGTIELLEPASDS